MGYNTTVIILNDAVHRLRHDRHFPRNLELAIGMASARMGPQTVPIGNHINGCTVVETHHADQTTLVAVGGNHATTLLQSFGRGDHHTEAGQVVLLRKLAEKLGYYIAKKPKRKGTPAA